MVSLLLNCHEWNSAVCVLLCLASFTQYDAYEMYVDSGSPFFFTFSAF